jgi:hypothetical protein
MVPAARRQQWSQFDYYKNSEAASAEQFKSDTGNARNAVTDPRPITNLRQNHVRRAAAPCVA